VQVLRAMVPPATEGAIRIMLDEDGRRSAAESAWPAPASLELDAGMLPAPEAELGLDASTLAWELVHKEAAVIYLYCVMYAATDCICELYLVSFAVGNTGSHVVEQAKSGSATAEAASSPWQLM
jgi:hypothetical protein